MFSLEVSASSESGGEVFQLYTDDAISGVSGLEPCAEATGNAGANTSVGNSSHENSVEDNYDVPNCTDQSERVMEQMRRCVLVHHQLSCLLIHNAALRAGLYNNEGNGAHAAGCSNSPCANGENACEELEESIHHLGGSTARLFSMALRDRHDLESMEDTLRQKVEEIVRNMRQEFVRSKCNAEISPLQTTQILALGKTIDKDPSTSSYSERRGSELCDPQDDINSDAEVAAATQECQKLATELASRQLEAARLREELRGIRSKADNFHQSETNKIFDRVQRAMDRNAELAEVLAQLLAVPAPPSAALEVTRNDRYNGTAAEVAPDRDGHPSNQDFQSSASRSSGSYSAERIVQQRQLSAIEFAAAFNPG